MYIQDYDGVFPEKPSDWMNILASYTNGTKAFQCPSLDKEEFGYAFDSQLAGTSQEKIAEPLETTIAIFESTNRAKNAASPGIGFSTRHDGVGNVAFADGHAKSLHREAFDALPVLGIKDSSAKTAKNAARDTKK